MQTRHQYSKDVHYNKVNQTWGELGSNDNQLITLDPRSRLS